jgi:hypothetical protein
MPIQKRHLNVAEQAKYRVAIEELRSAGLDVDIPEECFSESCLLDVTVAASPATFVFDLPTGGVGYAIFLRLVARKCPLILSHCKIATSWDNQIVLMNFDQESLIFRLGWLTFSRNEVLNQGFGNSLRFHHRGQMIEGTILASGLQPIPEAYRTGMRVPFQLTLSDTLGHEIDVEAKLHVHRKAKRKNAPLRVGGGLYEPLTSHDTDSVISREADWIPRRQHSVIGKREEHE